MAENQTIFKNPQRNLNLLSDRTNLHNNCENHRNQKISRLGSSHDENGSILKKNNLDQTKAAKTHEPEKKKGSAVVHF